jgi:hypothetical protein
VHHRLVGPLLEQRRDRIVLAVEQQQNRRIRRLAKVEEVAMLVVAAREIDGELLGELGAGDVTNGGAAANGEQERH